MLFQRASGGESEGATGADGEDAVIGLDDITGAREDEAVLLIDDGEQGLEPPKHAVTSPVLGELDGGTRKVFGEALQLLLEALEERERVGGRAREAREHLAALEGSDLQRVRFHYRFADAHLTVAAQGDAAVAAHGEDRGGADTWSLRHVRKIVGRTTGALEERRKGAGKALEERCPRASWLSANAQPASLARGHRGARRNRV